MPDLLYDKRDRYAVFTMNRPERLNALGGTMMDDLAEALRDFNADPEMPLPRCQTPPKATRKGG